MQLLPFEQFIDKSNQAKTVDELLDVFLATVKQHGMDKMIFCLLSDHKKIGLEAGVGHLRNYNPDWMEYYFNQGYDQIDPVISYCYQKLGTFTWEEMTQRLKLTPIQKTCLNQGIESGLNNGICTPLWGPHRFAGIGLASSEKKDTFDGRLDLITAYCNHFYIAFQRLHERQKKIPANEEVPNIYLTAKEKEILTWVHKGKSDNDIADILNISYSTVRFHLNKTYRKLHANHRILAAAKALSYGLIHP